VIVSTLVLRLKAVESFLERMQSVHSRTQQNKVQKNPDYEIKKAQILSGVGEDLIKKFG